MRFILVAPPVMKNETWCLDLGLADFSLLQVSSNHLHNFLLPHLQDKIAFPLYRIKNVAHSIQSIAQALGYTGHI